MVQGSGFHSVVDGLMDDTDDTNEDLKPKA
jgi:hypothetical protein